MVCVPVLLHKHVVVSWQDEGGGNEIQIQISPCNIFNKKILKMFTVQTEKYFNECLVLFPLTYIPLNN